MKNTLHSNFFYALLSGALFALSWPTYGFPFLLFIAFVPLLLAEHRISKSEKKYKFLKIFGLSYLSFFLWNYAATQWLHYAQRPDGSNAWEAFLPALFLNSFFMTFVFGIYHLVKKRIGVFWGLIFLSCLWISFEKLHLSWEITWPWLNLGNAFSEYYKFIQWYEFTGAFGGTLWVLLVNSITFYYVSKIFTPRRSFDYLKRRLFIFKKILLYNLILLIIPLLISFYIYRNYKEKSLQKLETILIQPCLNSYTEKYTKNEEDIISDIIKIADSLTTSDTDFILAPETAFPGKGDIIINDLSSDKYLAIIRKYLKKYPKVNFISGISAVKLYSDSIDKISPNSRYLPHYDLWMDSYNAEIQINNSGEKDQIYYKSKLVPGVEILPYNQYLKPLLGSLLLDFGGTTGGLGSQPERSVFSNPYNRAIVAPIICYESIYGEYVTEYVNKGANVLFISTNDSWWQKSQGYKQLLSYSRLRAIETRRDIARSANSGVSAFINQKGDIIDFLDYDKKGMIKGKVNLNDEITFYSKNGDWIARIALFLAGFIFIVSLFINLLKARKN